MTMFKYVIEYFDRGRAWTMYGCTLYATYNECDAAACDRCSDLVESGCTGVQADIVEVIR